MGYEFVGLEWISHDGRNTLRVYIDKEGGITVDDCELVSDQVEGVLDTSMNVAQQYLLEVSSPGLNRLLFKKKHYRDFVGEMVKVQIYHHQGRDKKIKGRLESVEEEHIKLVTQDEQVLQIPFENIKKANLIYDFSKK